jgi:hypothetical protein
MPPVGGLRAAMASPRKRKATAAGLPDRVFEQSRWNRQQRQYRQYQRLKRKYNAVKHQDTLERQNGSHPVHAASGGPQYPGPYRKPVWREPMLRTKPRRRYPRSWS